MADKELHELTSGTPELTDITVFGGPAGGAEVKKSTFSSIKDLLKTSYDALYQAILVSGTNIKTVNGNTILGSGNLSLPVLSDGNYTDATISSSGTVITINNDVVTNSKLANVASATFKGRTTVGTGDPEDMTATQATALLNTATTSLKGLMSSTDKTKLDGLANEWTLLTSSSYSAGTDVYDTGTLTTYDYYKVVVTGTTTGSATLTFRFNSDGVGSKYRNCVFSTVGSYTTTSENEFKTFVSALGSGYKMYGEYIVDRVGLSIKGQTNTPFNSATNSSILDYGFYEGSTPTSIQIRTASGIAGSIKVYGKNF